MIFIKQKWSAGGSDQFSKLIVNHFTNVNLSFPKFYHSVLNSNMKKQKTQL